MEDYKPTASEEAARKKVYEDFMVMRNLRNKKWKYFNDRTLKELIDDSELRLSNYVPTREEQGKEEWQANFSHPVTSNKLNAILAGVALDVPEVNITARNERSMKSLQRAYIVKNLVKHSYDKENKEEEVFFEAWEAAAKGTVIVYDGYLKQKAKRKVVTNYDPVTGKVEYKEEELVVKDECTEFIVPLENIYIWNFFVPGIQDQPKLAWVDYMDPSEFNQQFSKYPAHKFVKTSGDLISDELATRLFKDEWKTRTEKEGKPYEVIRYYDKFEDSHIIIANGVVLYDGPVLLGKKHKWYPFSKTIHFPFSPDFFYGNPLPNKLMGEQDLTNALYNMSADKTMKSMVPTLLVGNTNKDDFDLEDGIVSLDTHIYVQDINQAKFIQTPGIDNSDVKMIELISRGMDLTSVDSNQQGVAGRGVTAREVVIANENAKKLKGVFYMFLTSLWIQKIKLRIQNILTYYTDATVQQQYGSTSENPFDRYRRFIIENADLGDGKKGTLELNIAGSQEQLPTKDQLDSRSQALSTEYKENYKSIAMTSDYLDDWEFDVKVISESVYQKESSLTQAKMEDKIKVLAAVFPEYLQLNKEKIFKQVVVGYDDDPDEYDTNIPFTSNSQSSR